MRSFIADRGDARLRLDQAIVRRLTDVPRLSRTRVQRWIGRALVLVNERPARRASAVVAAGDRISVIAPDALEEKQRPQAEHAPLSILFEDEFLIAINKPAGIVVHPSYKHASGTLLNAIMGHVPVSSHVSLVHRLDKDTSGVLLVARSREVHTALQRSMTAGKMQKIYLAVVRGRPRRHSGTIAMPLGQDDRDRRRVVVCEKGRPSTTRYTVLRSAAGTTLLQCELVTGRMHQIRVHVAASGWPIEGDAVYGRPSELISRQALHAWRLSFPHPATHMAMEIVAPPPPDFTRLLDQRNVAL